MWLGWPNLYAPQTSIQPSECVWCVRMRVSVRPFRALSNCLLTVCSERKSSNRLRRLLSVLHRWRTQYGPKYGRQATPKKPTLWLVNTPITCSIDSTHSPASSAHSRILANARHTSCTVQQDGTLALHWRRYFTVVVATGHNSGITMCSHNLYYATIIKVTRTFATRDHATPRAGHQV